MNNIENLIKLFHKKQFKNITDDQFINKTEELIQKHKNQYFSDETDLFKKFPLSLILERIIDEIVFDNKNILNFKFKNKKRCCLAPYSTINFDTMGYMRVCCYNNEYIMGTYPEISLKNAWYNENRQNFINKLKKLDFSIGCTLCKKQIIEDDIQNALFSDFDSLENEISDEHPIVFNFDFGTICNYECIMCGGKWSSSIRKNREKLPPIKSPYDDSFVNQLEDFIPNLKFCNFLGGEPFLNPIYYKIWDLLLLKNPDINITIQTNGSIFNSKIKKYLESFPKLSIKISLDSLQEETYNKIRKNGNFNQVMKNIEDFKKYKVFTGISFCPMIQNVYELPDIVQYCIRNDIRLGLNDVHSHLGGKIKGIHEGESENTLAWIGSTNTMQKINVNNSELIPEVALKTLPKSELEDIIKHLMTFRIREIIDFKSEIHIDIYAKYKSFINKLIYMHSQK
jgi:MoaA/NifB/PqqE/SkfB family radical SAM enzyme